MANLACNVAGIEFPSVVFNAVGPKNTNLDELRAIARSASGAVMMKSATILPRDGNPEPRYAHTSMGSVSTSGLPNLGYREYVGIATQLKKEFPGKPVGASVAGLTHGDFPVLVQAFQDSDVDFIEINTHSCPKAGGKQLAHDPAQMDAMLQSVIGLGDKPIGLKLPPYFDADDMKAMADVFLRYRIAYLACIGNIPNALAIDAETETALIRPKGGIGTLGGDYAKPIALANVHGFSKLLGNKIAIVGVGGIKTGADAFEFLLAGADAVQIGTAFYEQGPGVFERVQHELSELLDRKGYKSAADAKGKMKTL
ncbi:MAG TPA: dihydroorotate oxidase [Candidatus Peribacteria bacterium]|nr:dihydroorotate oxidase [Candidatus Peribacteria bacterium]